ncbi:hypothetical protein [Neolewinella litorea]|uniref:Uncharacterized protein n=1 Tax=Neolewinella litorea TaxID=2562452 RepID=A0A4S4NDN0_9BACT|nr:hypothetical protein [Neolewinella litorea]THH37604.1 hypothetical protein E4021_14370 [Neolewinella litorea]
MSDYDTSLTASALPFGELDGPALQQWATMNRIEMVSMNQQLLRLETRLQQMEQEQQRTLQAVEGVRERDSERQAMELDLLRAEYRTAMDDVEQLLVDTDKLRSLHDWEQFVGQARDLGNPHSYAGFTESLAKLREEQKNSLRLPDIEPQDNPFLSSFYTLATALGSKNDAEEVAEINRLAIILDFAMQAGRQLDYVATEVAFARQTGDALYKQVQALRTKLYGLFNLGAGERDAAHISYFTQQFTSDFANQHRETIESHLAEIKYLQNEYELYHHSLLLALRKVLFALDQIEAHRGGNALADLADQLEARKATLQEELTRSIDVVARHGVGNG